MADDLLQQIAAAADVCLKPRRHAVRWLHDPGLAGDDCVVMIEARADNGERLAAWDLELEIYRSGEELNMMLTPQAPEAALLWHGSHPVWMRGESGERCARPEDGAPLEALCRRLRALLGGDAGAKPLPM